MSCRHPRDYRESVRKGALITPDWPAPEDGYMCGKCGAYVPQSRSLRGKRANKAGRRQSWETAKDMGGTNHEVEGVKYDVLTEMYAVQSKRGTAFPERLWKWLQEIPRHEGRIPVLVIRDAPGPGIKRRGVVIQSYEDFIDTTGVKA